MSLDSRAAKPTRSAPGYPYMRLHRAFLRQTIDLGGDTEKLEAGLNQFSGTQTADRLVITVGKFGAVDIFDTNKYAHDPRGDFMNWTIVDTGTFDYAADAWAYSVWRGGRVVPGSLDGARRPVRSFDRAQYNRAGSIVRPISVGSVKSSIAMSSGDSPARSRSPAFLTRGGMGSFADAIAARRADRRPRRHRGGASIHRPRRDQCQPGAADLGTTRRLRPRRMGRWRHRAL